MTEININTRHQKKQNQNFFKHLIFKIMKKQILFLAFFVLAVLASTTSSFGQLLPGVTNPTNPTPQPLNPLSCIATSEPLHPFAGVPYTYSLDGTAGEEHAASYTWWATQDPQFITGPVTVPAMTNTNFSGRLDIPDLVAKGATYGTTTAAATGNSVSITWSSGMLAKTKYQATAADAPKKSTFVVGYAEGENCADNIQVFEIAPLPNFTIDIAAINPTDDKTLSWDDNSTAKLCVDVVQKAEYNAGSHEIDMDYGTNTFYFEVAAANFVTDWTPSFSITSGLVSTQTAVLAMYPSLNDAKNGTNIIGAASGDLAVGDMSTTPGTFSWAPGTHLTATNAADVATGVSVFVKVVVTNNTEESLTSNPFALAVDARDDTETGIWDMEDEDCGGDPALDKPDDVDFATITVLPRPQLDDATTPETIPNPDAPVTKTP